ncbi:MAG: hypothetical protein U9Q70_00145, partial [Chloroflexota bacterium]|nr:hypothetical protein [Chloroflexota bacterium]
MKRLNKGQSSGDALLMVTVMALLAFGLLVLYSATFYVGVRFWHQQLRWMLLGGLLLVTLAYLVPYPFWQRLSIPLMGLTLIL